MNCIRFSQPDYIVISHSAMLATQYSRGILVIVIATQASKALLLHSPAGHNLYEANEKIGGDTEFCNFDNLGSYCFKSNVKSWKSFSSLKDKLQWSPIWQKETFVYLCNLFCVILKAIALSTFMITTICNE
jgi:hypothetical protein